MDRARYYYGYDYNGNRQWQEDPVASANSANLDILYAYDGLNRLTAYDRGDLNGGHTAITTLTFAQQWTLDQLNNWSGFDEDTDGNAANDLVQSRTHNDANEITAITASAGANWVDPTYDAAGNMITGPTPGDETSAQKYTYDAWNRLVKVTDGSDVTVLTYGYDARNYRITKGVYAAGSLSYTDHTYYTDDWQALEVRREISGVTDSDPREQFVWYDGYIDALTLRYYDADTDANLAENNDGAHYYLYDAQYSVTALTDAAGTVLERYRYDAYGRMLVLDENFATDADGASDIDNATTYTGREFDRQAGIYQFRNRYYEPASGRFMSRDPLEYVDGMNLYAGYFVPDGSDPSGKESWLISPPPGSGWYHPGNPNYPLPVRPAPAPTPDQGSAIALCGNDQQCISDVNALFALLRGCPTLHYRPWPFATGNRCIKWADNCFNRVTDAQLKKQLPSLYVERVVYRYCGKVPTFRDHAVLHVKIKGTGKTFYLDNALYGGCDDHIFFAIPPTLLPEGSKCPCEVEWENAPVLPP